MRYPRVLAAIVMLMTVVVFFSQADDKTTYKYVGAKKCMACHKAEKLGGLAYSVWEKTAHAKAYQTLLGDEAKKIAKEKGLKTAPAESEACLKCHVTGGGAAKNVEAGFKKEEGITCEACHGAASGYLAVHAKKGEEAKAKAMTVGMMIADKSGKLCENCHNAESPTHKEFKFAEMWKKIEHGAPPKK